MSTLVDKDEFYKNEVFELLKDIFSDDMDENDLRTIKDIVLGQNIDKDELIQKIIGKDEN